MIEQPRTMAEAYASAIQSDDLRVSVRERNDADVLIAAGLASSRFGTSLLRLRAEWDSTAVPDAGRFVSQIQYESEIRMIFRGLKSWRECREMLIALLNEDKEECRNEILATRLLVWWLDSNCDACEGRGYQVIEGTRRLSDRHCPACRGTGRVPIPGGQRGREAMGVMENYARAAEGQMVRKLIDLVELPKAMRKTKPTPAKKPAP